MKYILGDKVVVESRNGQEEVIVVKDSKDIVEVMEILKNNTLLQYKNIIDITAVDKEEEGLIVVYMLLSVRFSKRVRVVCKVEDEIKSIRGVYEGANWLEREVFDMFGIRFVGHGDLRRILTDYGFKGNPLLKSFNKNENVRYDEELKAVSRK